MKFAMWRSMATTWSCTSCTCRVTIWIPLVGNHMKRLWFDIKSWTWVDGWVLNHQFLMDTFKWLELTQLVITICESMKTSLKCHMQVTCRILDLYTMKWGSSPYVKAFVNPLKTWAFVGEGSFLELNWSLKVEDHLWNHHMMYWISFEWNTTCMIMFTTCRIMYRL